MGSSAWLPGVSRHSGLDEVSLSVAHLFVFLSTIGLLVFVRCVGVLRLRVGGLVLVLCDA